MNVAETIVAGLAQLGVTTVWGVVGDALNPFTDAIRRDGRISWIGVRHEEAGAFAASAQAQVGPTVGVCMGTVGPGSIHLLNGLYDAAKSHAPVLAICGQVPLAEIGSRYFQEVDNDLLFTDVASYRTTISSPAQLPRVLEQAVNSAYATSSVSVLTVPGDVGEMEVPGGDRPLHFVTRRPRTAPDDADLDEAVRMLDDAPTVTILAGRGAIDAREDLLSLAGRLAAPMVLTLKAKEGLEHDNPFEVGQSGLIGNPASKVAFDGAELLLMLGTDFPYPQWLPDGVTTIQVDRAGSHIGRRTAVDLGIVADAGLTIAALAERVAVKDDTAHLDAARERYQRWLDQQHALVADDGDASLPHRLLAKVRPVVENPGGAIRPELVAALIDDIAGESTAFTTDTGMSTVWLSRFIRMRESRRLVGSYNLGSMANAMPQALGIQALDRNREVVALCGDGGLTMLLGDLLTAVSEDLPVRIVVFNNGRLGMVKLEQEQAGLPEYGTTLHNPDLAAVARAMGLRAWRVEATDELDSSLREAFLTPGPVLVDVVTNPNEIALPPSTGVHDAWGFAIAKVKETLESRSD